MPDRRRRLRATCRRVLRRAGLLALAGLLVLAPSRPARGAVPPAPCGTVRPIVDVGRTDVVGNYAELDAQCYAGPLSVRVGARYTEVTGSVWPVGALSYGAALGGAWEVLATASVRELVNDYEANRLPEVTLRWKPRARDGAFSTSLDLSAGVLQSVQFGTTAVRAGAVATVATPTLRLGPVSAGASLQAGDYAYGTGQNTAFYVAEVDAGVRISESVGLEMIYVNQQGFGTSPLVFDFVNLERFLIAQLHVAVGPDAELTLETSVFVPAQTPPPTSLVPSPPLATFRDASIVYSRPSQGWSVGLGWHQDDNTIFLTATLR